MKNKGRMQIFKKQKVVFGPRDYQENVRRSRKCRVPTPQGKRPHRNPKPIANPSRTCPEPVPMPMQSYKGLLYTEFL